MSSTCDDSHRLLPFNLPQGGETKASGFCVSVCVRRCRWVLVSHCLRDGCPADRLCTMLHALLNTRMDRDLCLRARAPHMRAHNEHTGRQSGEKTGWYTGATSQKRLAGKCGIRQVQEKYQVGFYFFQSAEPAWILCTSVSRSSNLGGGRTALNMILLLWQKYNGNSLNWAQIG